MKIIKTMTVATVLFAGFIATPVQAGTTFDAVKNRGFVQCGVNSGLPGFSNPDDKGNWTGLDVDLCRGVAAAMFGDASRTKFTPLTAKERFVALQSGEIDILSRNTTWTLTRDGGLGLNFAGVLYYDGQGFMVPKQLGLKSAKELDGAVVCVLTGTTTAMNLGDYFRSNNMSYKPAVFNNSDEVAVAYDAGRCDVLTTDQSQLYAQRLRLKVPSKHHVLPEVISKEPLGPVVRQGDDAWFNIVKWTLFAMINAEELGISSANIDQVKAATNDPSSQRLLGLSGDMGTKLGVSNAWAYNLIKQVGNYSEIFERNVGEESQLKIARGLNALWSKGGLQYAPPLR